MLVLHGGSKLANVSRENAPFFSRLVSLSISLWVNKQNTTTVTLGMQTLIAYENSVFRPKQKLGEGKPIE